MADVNRVAKQYLVDQSAITAQLKPVPSGEAVSEKGFGGSEQLTSAPTKPVALPAWAESHLLAREAFRDSGVVDGHHAAQRVARDRQDRQDESDRHGAGDHLAQREAGSCTGERRSWRCAGRAVLLRYERPWTGWHFRRRSTISRRTKRRGLNFSLRVLKQDFSRGVQLLADNELNPALPGGAGNLSRRSRNSPGNLKSPGYRTDRAVLAGLLPANDPCCANRRRRRFRAHAGRRQKTTTQTAARPDLTTIVVIGDVTL